MLVCWCFDILDILTELDWDCKILINLKLLIVIFSQTFLKIWLFSTIINDECRRCNCWKPAGWTRSEEDSWHGSSGLQYCSGHEAREVDWRDSLQQRANTCPSTQVVLSQSTFLHTMLRSLSCCQGRCAHQNILSILLPDTSYTHLLKVSTFLYTGCLKCSESDREPILVMISWLRCAQLCNNNII